MLSVDVVRSLDQLRPRSQAAAIAMTLELWG